MAKAKSKKRRRRVSQAVPETGPPMPRSMTIREADNGFVIETYGPRTSQTLVAESAEQALKAAQKWLGGKKKA